MSILVTGSAGFIGSHLVDRLLDEGEVVVAIDNFDAYYDPQLKKMNIAHHARNSKFHFYEMDARKDDALAQVIKQYDVDRIAHLAARPGVRGSIDLPALYNDLNVTSMLAILELARRYDVANVVYASSSSVYGMTETPFVETDCADAPISPYAASKRCCELYCYTYSSLYNIPISCQRLFTVYGPRQRPDMAVRKFIELIDKGSEIPVFGDGSTKRDYTYVDDIIDGLVSALTKKFDFEIFNLGNSEVVELRHLISVIENKLGKSAKIRHQPPELGDVIITYADISKARRLLGYDPKISIEEGVERTVNWYRDVFLTQVKNA